MSEEIGVTFREARLKDIGLLEAMLEKSYAPLKALREKPWIVPDDLAKGFAGWVKENLHNQDEIIFMTDVDGESVGFGSFSVAGNCGVISRNCVVPKYQSKGLGKAQVKRMIYIAKEMGLKEMKVKTGSHPFFVPAQRMYESVEFAKVGEYDDGNKVGRILVHYELSLR